MLLLLLMIGSASARTCYTANTTSTPYDVLERATVETQRGCEVLCDAVNSSCVGFSFKDVGLVSSCVLLTPNTAYQICAAPTTIFLKQTNCSARTNLTAEFGEDPCVDEIFPSLFQGFGVNPIYPIDQAKWYIIRAIDESGRRITLDNERWNMLVEDGDMWAYQYGTVRVRIVAAVAALAGGTKCPCAPLAFLPQPAVGYPATPDIINPCRASTKLSSDVVKSPADGLYTHDYTDTASSIVTCKAGLWVLWKQSSYSSWGVNGLSCWGTAP